MATDPKKPNEPDPNKPKGDAQGPPARSHWTVGHTLALLLILGVYGAVCWTQPPVVGFLSGLGLLTLFVVIAGHGVVGEWLGALIDERNRMSMSRLQTVLWTVVVLSGFLAAAVWNVRPSDPAKVLPPNPPPGAKVEEKLAIVVPAELWAVMGISVASLAGTPLIRSTLTKKDGVEGDNWSREMTALNKQAEVKAGDATREAYAAGRIACFRSPSSARVADLFQAEQTNEATHLDLGKVQVFFFTALLVFAYAVMMVQEFTKAGADATHLLCIPALPKLDQGMVALLGISHAGYLANKAVDKGQGK
jgi:hypothetical protein